MSKRIVVGYWMSQKKLKKLLFNEFVKYCALDDIELVEIDLDIDLCTQGPFHALLHKLSDVAILADSDPIAQQRWNNIKNYAHKHPDVIIIDPFKSIHQLCDRFLQYSLTKYVCKASGGVITTPNFAVLKTSNIDENSRILSREQISFPIVCKPLQAHGSQLAHRMMLIFCAEGLADVQPPCIAQAFVAHNALLYKLYVVGDSHFLVSRPSLKNFVAEERETLFFDSQNISGSGCESNLTKLDHQFDSQTAYSTGLVGVCAGVPALIQEMRARTRLSNFGIDLIVEKDQTKKRIMVIDVNCFPDISCLCCEEKIRNHCCNCDYKAFSAQNPPSFFVVMHKMLRSELDNASATAHHTAANNNESALCTSMHHNMRLDSGIGSATSSESDGSDSEKRRRNESWKGIGYFPNWTRIKRFYGIPKPSRPLSDAFDDPPSSSLLSLSSTIPFCLPAPPPSDDDVHNAEQHDASTSKHVLTTNQAVVALIPDVTMLTKHRSDTIP